MRSIVVRFPRPSEPKVRRWARFVAFGRKNEIVREAGAGGAIRPDIAKALANHRYALILNERGRGVAESGDNQVAFAFGPVGLVLVAPAQMDFTFAELMEAFGRERRKDPSAMAALKAFIAELDPAILQILKRGHALRSQIYNWCLIDPERRSRAIQSYPALVHKMLEDRSCDMAIALSGSLEQALSSTTDRPAAVIRHVARKAPAMFGDQLGAGMSLMTRVPQDLWPHSREELERFLSAESFVKSCFDHTRVPAQLLIDTLRAPNDTWRETADSYGFSSSLDDAIHSLITAILLPMVIGNGEAVKRNIADQLWNKRSRTSAAEAVRRTLMIEIAGSSGMNALKRFSDAWHERYQVLDRSTGDLPLTLGLPRLTDGTIEIDGVRYRALDTLQALKDESAEMSHCIKTYGRQVIRGDTFPYACDGAAGRFTMTVTRKDGRLSLDDARGFEDETRDAYHAAAQRLVDHLVAVKAQPSGGEEIKTLQAKTDGPQIWIGEPAIAWKYFEENFERWMAIMPTRLRVKRPSDLLLSPTAAIVRKYLLSKAKRNQPKALRAAA